MSIADLRSRSKSNFQKLQDQLQKENSQNSFVDERFWTLATDAAGNGNAVIRFLPAIEGEDVAWAKYYNHSFKVDGSWFIENCPTTIGGKCPVCDSNNKYWNSGVDSDKEIARERKRKLSYVSNILVVSDPKNPDNEGKVFLYRYGVKIFNKIQDKLTPEFDDQTPVNVFDFWEGANFRLRAQKNQGGYANYDKSEFDSPSAVSNDDEYLEKLYATQYSLADFTKPEKFKPYTELETAFNKVVSGDTKPTTTPKTTSQETSRVDRTVTKSKRVNEVEDEVVTAKNIVAEDDPPFDLDESKTTNSVQIDEDDDDIDYFKKLSQS